MKNHKNNKNIDILILQIKEKARLLKKIITFKIDRLYKKMMNNQ